MKQFPFTIDKLVFEHESQVQLVPIGSPVGVEGRIPGYFVMSSAPPNVEDAQESSPAAHQQAQQGIDEIAEHLYRMMTTSADGTAKLVITVHGYNTSRSGVEAWYKNIFKYVNRHDPAISSSGNAVFIGYRWPSEGVDLGKFWEALAALPPLPRDLLLTGGVCALALLILNLIAFGETIWGFLISLVLVAFFVLGTMMLALVVLRLVVYFRDNYRANNFGVLDLVELLRQIDGAILQRTAQEMFPRAATKTEHLQAMAQAKTYWQRRSQNKVKLSFIGHSMGGFVVTNVIRILSDVFDTNSLEDHPDGDIGDVFRLERMILASPDITVLTIITNRANFLAASLRRFSESYLFCSEGDIALRIASTAANYITFPSRTQVRGYRLGNVAIENKLGNTEDYGLINLAALDKDFPVSLPIGEAIAQSQVNVLENLFLTAERFQPRGVVTLADLFQDQTEGDITRATVADLFTYFDCTDYFEIIEAPADNTCSAEPIGLLSRAKGHAVLKPWDYFLLTLDYATGKRDVHGGYFQGQFSQELLYRLAFLGFSDYLQTLDADAHVALSQFHLACQAKQIQGFLSPFRYRVDIQGGSLEGTMKDLLDAIQANK